MDINFIIQINHKSIDIGFHQEWAHRIQKKSQLPSRTKLRSKTNGKTFSTQVTIQSLKIEITGKASNTNFGLTIATIPNHN